MELVRGLGSGGRLLATAALLVVAFSGPVAAHTGDDLHHHDGWMGSHGGTFGYLWMTLWMVVLTGVSLCLGCLFLTRREANGKTTDDAWTILWRRYVEGDIDAEEFDARCPTLHGGE